MSAERDQNATAEALKFYGETLSWLEQHHADFGRTAIDDLGAPERVNAIWKLSGQSLALARALIALLQDGYTNQTWPIMRAIHEADRLLGAVADLEEEGTVGRWLEDKEVKPRETRAAEQRQADRLSEQMEAVGLEPLAADVEQLLATVYGGMSKAAHLRRSVVDESVDDEARTMVYGPDPDPSLRFEFAIFAGALIEEVLLKVGDALCVLYGPGFYREHLTPVLRRFRQVLEALDVIEVAQANECLIPSPQCPLADRSAPKSSCVRSDSGGSPAKHRVGSTPRRHSLAAEGSRHHPLAPPPDRQ